MLFAALERMLGARKRGFERNASLGQAQYADSQKGLQWYGVVRLELLMSLCLYVV